jgi:DNA repair protein RadD
MIASAVPTLRPYQVDLVERLRARYRAGVRALVCVAVTGAGKTVMASALVAQAVARGRRVLFVAHRKELIDQASAKLASFGVAHGVIRSGHPGDPTAAVQVASVQTLARRLGKSGRVSVPPGWDGQPPAQALDGIDLVVVDECQHATAASWRAVLEAFPRARVLGLTATPYRLDGSGLGDLFEAIEAGPQVAELIGQGFLVPPVVYAPPPPEEIARLRLVAGEVRQDEAARLLDRRAPIEEIVTSWRRRAAGRTTVGFACTVAHAEHLAEAFRTAGISAAVVDGATPAEERAATLRRLAEGRLSVLFNCMLLTEGWDLPACSAVILARPTMSRSLYKQMVGRGLRSAPDKTDCVILDHVGLCYRHGAPDEDDAYSLAGAVERAAGSLLVCPQCDQVVGAAPVCPGCGWVVPVPPERGEAVEREAPLERPALELAPAQALTWEERRVAYAALVQVALRRGHQPGWAAHRFKERFGQYPPWAWRDELIPAECA